MAGIKWVEESAVAGASPATNEPAASAPIDIYWTRPEEVSDPAMQSACAALLGDEESPRWRQFAFPEPRDVFLISHAFTRCVLTRHADVAPAAWRFTANRYGRPEIVGPADSPRFSLSHTRGLVAVAVSHGAEVGVDVESLARPAPFEVMPKVFAASEIAALERLETSRQSQRFFALWILKEAYAKARGLGFSISFPEIVFDLDRGGPIRLISADRSEADALRWRFELHGVTEEYLLAMAYAAADGEESCAVHLTRLVARLD